jgi:hypothetical protein
VLADVFNAAGSRRLAAGLLVALAALLTVLGTDTSGAAGPKRPSADLAVGKLVVKPSTVRPGQKVTVVENTANKGQRKAAASKTAYFLSTDSKATRSDRKLGQRKLKPLKSGAKSAGKTTLRVPATTKPGAYKLLACADAARAVKEKGERNNCRAAALAVRAGAVLNMPTVTPPAGGGGQPGAGPPITVAPTLESGGAVSEVVSAAGGTLTATSGNGTTYTLEFPPDALFADTKITMTPVTSLAGAPLSGGLAGAVKLEPEGLTLNGPATLTIDPGGAPPPLDQQTGVIAEGDGESFHQYPLAFGPALQLQLMHFSIAGAGGATPGDRAAMAARPPVTSQAQWEQAVAERIRQARQSEASGTPDFNWPDDLKPVHLSYYDNVVRPTMLAGINNDAGVDAAIREGLTWLKKIELYGNAGDPDYASRIKEVYETLEVILVNALNRAKTACHQHDLRAIHRIVQVARTAALLGIDLGTGLDVVADCLRFEVELDSRLVGPVIYVNGSITRHVQAKIPIGPTFINERLTFAGASGDGPLSWLEFSGASYAPDFAGCLEGSDPTTATLTADEAFGTTSRAALSLDITPRQEGTPASPDDTFGAILSLNTRSPKEIYEHTFSPPGDCISGPMTRTDWELFYAFPFGLADAVVKAPPVTVFTKMQRGLGDLVLLFEIDRTFENDSVEETTLKVFHKPVS